MYKGRATAQSGGLELVDKVAMTKTSAPVGSTVVWQSPIEYRVAQCLPFPAIHLRMLHSALLLHFYVSTEIAA